MKNYQYNIAVTAVSVSVLCIMFLTIVPFARITETMAKYSEQNVVIIDAGHGDFDPGTATPDGTVLEKDVNLEISFVLRDLFEANGVEVVMIRENDIAVGDNSLNTISEKKKSDIRKRVEIANSIGENAVYLSIHQNAFSDYSQSGTQILYGSVNSESRVAAEYIMEKIEETLQPDNRRELKEGNGNIYILEHIKIPTVLIECGFLTNAEDAEKLQDPEYQKQFALTIFEGYSDYINNLHLR